MHKGKYYFGEYFDIEEHAAMKINLLCDKYEIKRKNPMINIDLDVKRKNPMINIDLDEIRKVMHLSVYIIYENLK